MSTLIANFQRQIQERVVEQRRICKDLYQETLRILFEEALQKELVREHESIEVTYTSTHLKVRINCMETTRELPHPPDTVRYFPDAVRSSVLRELLGEPHQYNGVYGLVWKFEK